ncbi:MAG: beta-N-acetylhexosaminidase [Cyclobacteriaceae bacterium]|nr:beta-N-acetylhexosaminidase [Cyclobacteriaceae bacterium]UYN85960.1 MAG: beta-N-acetylhexosaminidase [Cyclobacteriaceae bacterium]
MANYSLRLTITLILFLVAACKGKKEEQAPSPAVTIVPLPVSVNVTHGHYTLPDTVTISAINPDEISSAVFLVDFFTTQKVPAKIVSDSTGSVSLRSFVSKEVLPEGYYRLVINADGVDIFSTSASGLFYGIQSLIQLVQENPTGLQVPLLSITDFPRFNWRGLHLDVCRHFFPVDFIKRYIDLMAQYKFNTFHWHLTEDQGWRIEIKKYPKLAAVAAYRDETLIGHYSDVPHTFDGQRYGGYYTQEEIKEVVAYAQQRHITIVPEIEMPGHALAALSAYPELGCTGGPYKAATLWGVFDDVFCAGKESTFTFFENVLDEVLALFPGEYIHVGGDECPKVRWQACPLCQERMKAEALADEHELQSYFIQRIEKYLNARGRKLIGWDEILEGGLAPHAAVMSWRGEDGGIAAAQAGHNVVMTPGFALYFDHYQGEPANEPVAIGGNTPLKKVYHYEPIPAQLSQDEHTNVLGAQANVWTEYIKTTDHVEYMVYPRALALAEVVWSPQEKRDWDSFVQRLPQQFMLLDRHKVNYRKPSADDLK